MEIRSEHSLMWTAVADISVLPWCLDEKTGIEHIKYAYEQGVNTFEYAHEHQ